jgi:hypothetical protein
MDLERKHLNDETHLRTKHEDAMAAVRRLQGLGFGLRTRRAAYSRCQGHLHPSPSKCFLSVNRVFYTTVTRLAEKVHTFDRSETFQRCCVSDHVKRFNDAVLVTT